MATDEKSPLLRSRYHGSGNAFVRTGSYWEDPDNFGFNFCMPHRFRLLLLMFIGIAIHVSDKNNFSFALVAMTNFTASRSADNVTSQCIIGGMENSTDTTDNTTSREINIDGEFPWSPEQQSLLLSSYFYGFIILQLPAGYFAERYGGKWISALAMGMGGLLSGLLPITARFSFNTLVVNRFLSGLFTGAAMCGMLTMWGKWAPAQEVSTLAGAAQVGIPLGQAASYISGGYFAQLEDIGGWPLIFYSYSGSVFIWLLFWVVLVHNKPADDPMITYEERSYIETHTGQRDKAEMFQYQRPPIRGMLTSPQVLTQWFVMITDMFGYYVIVNSIPVYFQQVLGLNILDNGLVMALAFLTQILSTVVVARLSDVLRSRNIVSTRFVRGFNTLVGSGGQGLCMVLLGVFVKCNATQAIALVVLSQFLGGFLFAGHKIVFLEIAPIYLGTLLGIGLVLGNCMGFVAPFFVELLTDNGVEIELWGLTFIASGAVMMLGSALFAIFVRDEEQGWAKPMVKALQFGSSYHASYSQFQNEAANNFM